MRWAMTRVLPDAGPREDQQRAFGVDDGVVLGGVEAIENGHTFHPILSAGWLWMGSGGTSRGVVPLCHGGHVTIDL